MFASRAGVLSVAVVCAACSSSSSDPSAGPEQDIQSGGANRSPLSPGIYVGSSGQGEGATLYIYDPPPKPGDALHSQRAMIFVGSPVDGSGNTCAGIINVPFAFSLSRATQVTIDADHGECSLTIDYHSNKLIDVSGKMTPSGAPSVDVRFSVQELVQEDLSGTYASQAGDLLSVAGHDDTFVASLRDSTNIAAAVSTSSFPLYRGALCGLAFRVYMSNGALSIATSNPDAGCATAGLPSGNVAYVRQQ
jgi:hypothetical protein